MENLTTNNSNDTTRIIAVDKELSFTQGEIRGLQKEYKLLQEEYELLQARKQAMLARERELKVRKKEVKNALNYLGKEEQGFKERIANEFVPQRMLERKADVRVEKVRQAVKMYNENPDAKVKDLAERLGVSERTFFRYIKRAEEAVALRLNKVSSK